MNKSDDESTIDLNRILTIFIHNIAVLIFVTLVCGSLGYVYSKYITKPTYSASATMYVNNYKYQTDTPIITESDLNASSNLVDTVAVILKSHTVLTNVIKELNLNLSYEELSAKVSITEVRKTQVMNITVTDRDPHHAVEIAQKIVDLAPNAVMKSMDSGSLRVIDEPWSTGRPVAPNTMKITLIAAIAGFAATFVIIVLCEIFDNKFKTSNDIQNVLDLPVIGIIPYENSAPSKDKKGKKGA